ncbi:hypothetical protein Snoj_25330 [Streptomyces nojiriensis]|uniref:Uncharacterized protein n=1 Tax=Streptomyces nojiriensis TaxID=66374 RepID=A0ABQ3SKE3_9ACTN|nr:hypothetical protein JYK04_08086 [Streptomyces nojiriensis]GGS29121.1 hypothetical protein GCM10010205_68910 [Streptomyces nojiriensis]GHI68615.1 hypothetical protein Snoj_25330 [Streptomyces nojiriensis]
MPSVVRLLEQRELTAHGSPLTARRRVDDLREEAERLQAELAVAEREWNEWVIVRSRVGEVLAPGNDAVVGPAASGCPPLPRSRPGTGSSGRTTAHSASDMSVGYRRSRAPWSLAFPNLSARQSQARVAEVDPTPALP